MRVAPRIELTQEEENELKRLARSNSVSVRLARRARIVLLAAAGYSKTLSIDRLRDLLSGTQAGAFSVLSDNQAADQLQKARRKRFKTLHGRTLKTG